MNIWNDLGVADFSQKAREHIWNLVALKLVLISSDTHLSILIYKLKTKTHELLEVF